MPYMQTLVVDGEKVRRQRRDAANQPGWRLRVHDPRTGKQPESTFYGTYEAAVRELVKQTAQIAALAAPRVAHHKAVTIGDWIPDWLAGYAWKVPPSSNGKYAGVRRAYSTWSKAQTIAVSQLAPALGEGTRMSRITHETLMDTIAGMTRLDADGRPSDIPLADSTRETIASVARAMFRDAVKAGVISRHRRPVCRPAGGPA